ncbi:MAG: CBS domain-containing protein, partial [Proteobacteria bacterium]|nr:CBS domain-containing protein [Pseudomonadota bacterium]
QGIALAGHIDAKSYMTYCMMGDGEIQEGQVWEAFMSAAKFKLDNLVAILDLNGGQIDGSIDQVVGYVDAKDLLNRVLAGQSLSMKADAPINPLLALPDSLTLSEVLERLREARDDFAVIINEYALVVGVITLNDIIRALVGDDVEQVQEEQILRRDDSSWLVDGATAATDLMRVLGIDDAGGSEHYETVAGFMMYHLRKIPRRTDRVEFGGYRFEVLDVDNHRIDQLLVSRLNVEAGEISSQG